MVLLLLILICGMVVALFSELEKGREPASEEREDCPSCGLPVDQEWLICPHCRLMLREHCSECRHQRAVFHRYCPYCGSAGSGKSS